MTETNDGLLAEQHIEAAESALADGSLSRSDRITRAIALYEKAGMAFSIRMTFDKSATAYEKAAQLCAEVDLSFTEASNYSKAGDMFRHAKAHIEAIQMWTLSAESFLRGGKLSSAAKQYMSIAQLEIGNKHPLPAAIAYEKAAKFYELENSVATGAQALEKAGNLYLGLPGLNHKEHGEDCLERAMTWYERTDLGEVGRTRVEKRLALSRATPIPEDSNK